MEYGRDAYGFALRPQHVQRYIEYTGIYKEEETERAEIWNKFLEWQEKSDQVCISEEEPKKIVRTEVTDLETESASGRVGEENDYSSERNSFSDDLRQCESTKEVQHVKESALGKEVPLREESEPDKELQLPKESQSDKEVEHPKESEIDEGAQLPEESEPDKQEQLLEGIKVCNIKWSQIRKSLFAIETIMSYRLKKGKFMEDEQRIESKDNLPSITEVKDSRRVSEENFKEEVCLNDTSRDKLNASIEESYPSTNMSPEPFFPWKEELEVLVRGGVPKDLRGEVWQAFVGVKARRMEKYYQEILAQVSSADDSQDHDITSGVPMKWKRQIEKDIPRTFPGHPALNDYGRDSLRRILLAYARHNPSVGYCQAMNFFAGLLLLLMPEENAFWTFVGIIDDYFDGYYTEEMIESQVDQLVFEELMRERFPKLAHHLDYLGVQVAWITGPWFLSIFVNMLPWESVLRVWDVLLFDGNRVMLFRTGLALMELYGPALVTTKDAGDAITLLQSLAGSTFDSSQLVLTACMGYLTVTEARLQELREKHRPAVLDVVEERSKMGRIRKDSRVLASKLYSFKQDRRSVLDEEKTTEGICNTVADAEKSHSKTVSSELNEILGGLEVDSEPDSPPDIQEQVVWLKAEMCRLLEEKRSATLRSEELETALMERVKQDNRRQLSAEVERLEEEASELRQLLSDKKEQESAMVQVLMRLEQEQRITEEARITAEQDGAAQKFAFHVLEEKYEKVTSDLAQMEKRVAVAESTLEATLQYQSGQVKATSSPRSQHSQGSVQDGRKTSLLPFGLGWGDKNKGKPSEDSGGGIEKKEEGIP